MPKPVARVVIVPLTDGRKAKVLRAIDERLNDTAPWIASVPEGTLLYDQAGLDAAVAAIPDYSELLQRIRAAAGDPGGKLMQDELVARIAANHSGVKEVPRG
jgi:hypothetical protein